MFGLKCRCLFSWRLIGGIVFALDSLRCCVVVVIVALVVVVRFPMWMAVRFWSIHR